MPIRAMALVRTRFEDWLPEPLTVATRTVKSLTTRAGMKNALFALGNVGPFLRELDERPAANRKRLHDLLLRTAVRRVVAVVRHGSDDGAVLDVDGQMPGRVDESGIGKRGAALARKNNLCEDASAAAAVERHRKHLGAVIERPLVRSLGYEVAADRALRRVANVDERMRLRVEARREDGLVDPQLRRLLDQSDDLGCCGQQRRDVEPCSRNPPHRFLQRDRARSGASDDRAARSPFRPHRPHPSRPRLSSGTRRRRSGGGGIRQRLWDLLARRPSAKYRCSASDYLFFIAGQDRSVSERLSDAPPPPPPKPVLLSGTAPQSFLYVQPTFVVFDKGQVACNKPIPQPLDAKISVENDQDSYYASLTSDPSAAPNGQQLALKLRTPTHQYHYVRIPIPFPVPWTGWPESVRLDVTEDMVDGIASDPVDTLLCPKMWRTSAG